MNDNGFLFFDTSALIKYYHDELGRQNVVDLVDNPNNRIFISRLGLIEWVVVCDYLSPTGQSRMRSSEE